MLLQFKAINFQSIKEEAILSMVPSSDKSHPENLAHMGKRDALKSAAIYGAKCRRQKFGDPGLCCSYYGGAHLGH